MGKQRFEMRQEVEVSMLGKIVGLRAYIDNTGNPVDIYTVEYIHPNGVVEQAFVRESCLSNLPRPEDFKREG